ncbi:9452_t:CDS:1, partial [Funneliformis geosporum]
PVIEIRRACLLFPGIISSFLKTIGMLDIPNSKGLYQIGNMTFGYDHNLNQQNKKFEIVMTDNGRKASFIFLSIVQH